MQVVSAREFRANQTKVLSAARNGQTVVITSRVGTFKIVPVTSDDTIVEREIRAAHAEVMSHVDGKTILPRAKDIVF
ncbi:MAG: type II toxin-antitoxin system prevent-host-death family antitoxin [Duncaniella sp.]|nr:type II toxin-antitoxin system prevent-host-death family antitoxin [Duncaniella sp.]